MVWNTTQSAFYKAIDAFNNGEITTEKQRESDKDIHCDNCGDTSLEKCPCSEDAERRREAECDRDRRTAQMSCPCCRSCQRQPASPLPELFSDKDMLLIAGLILILSKQNADRKLILALAFVLLT